MADENQQGGSDDIWSDEEWADDEPAAPAAPAQSPAPSAKDAESAKGKVLDDFAAFSESTDAMLADAPGAKAISPQPRRLVEKLGAPGAGQGPAQIPGKAIQVIKEPPRPAVPKPAGPAARQPPPAADDFSEFSEGAPSMSSAPVHDIDDFSEFSEGPVASPPPPPAPKAADDFSEFSEAAPAADEEPADEWGVADFATEEPAPTLEPLEPIAPTPARPLPPEPEPIELDAEAPAHQEEAEEWGTDEFAAEAAPASGIKAETPFDVNDLTPSETPAIDSQQAVSEWDDFEEEPPAPSVAAPTLEPEEPSLEPIESAPSAEEAVEEDWGDVATEAEEDWGDVEADVGGGGTGDELPPLPLSVGPYTAHLQKRIKDDAEAATRAAKERQIREAQRPSFQHTGDSVVDGQLEVLYREFSGRTEKPQQALLLRRIAEVYAAKALEVKPAAGKRMRGIARECLMSARAAGGDTLAIAKASRELCELDEAWESALVEATHEEKLAARSGPGRQVDAALAKARILERLERFEDAEAAYRQVLAASSGHFGALHGLDAVLTRRQSWPALAGVLEQELAAVQGGEEQAQIRYRLGQVYARLLAAQGDASAGAAGEDMMRKMVDSFRSAAAKSANPVPALMELRQIYSRVGQWSDFIAVSNEIAEKTEQAAEKSYLFYHNGRVQIEKFANLDAALGYFKKILEIDPNNLLTLKALEKIYVEADNSAGLLDVYRRSAEIIQDPSQKAVLSLKAGRLYDEILGDTEKAIEWYSRALEIDSKNQYVLRALGKLHARNKDWAKLLPIYEYEAEAATDIKQKIDFLIKRADLLVGQFGNVDQAIEILRSALELDDTNLAIYRELGRALAQAKRWPELIRLYEAEITLTSDKARLIAIYMSLGELWQEDFEVEADVDKYVRAIQAYTEVLNIDPAHTPALTAMGKLFAQHKDWQRLSEVYSLEVSLAKTPEARVPLFIRMAELEEEHNKNDERAVFFLRKALELDPKNKMVLSGLVRLTPRLGQWDDLLQSYIRDAETTEDQAYMAALHQLIGELWKDQFGFPAKADESFRRAASLRSGNIVALRCLEENYEDEGKWDKLVEVLLEDLSETTDPSQKIVTLKRLAVISELRLKDPSKAGYYYQQILEIDPHNLDAMEEAARIYGMLEDWGKQAEALERLARTITDPAYLAQLRLTLGRLLMQRHPVEESAARARECLQKVLESEPENREALDLLASILHESAEWDALAQVLRRRITLDDDPGVRAGHYRWLGKALIEGSASGEEAIAALEKALELDPGDLSTRMEVARGCEKAGQFDRAAGQLRALQAEVHDVDQRNSLAVQLARIAYEHLGQHQEAIKILRTVLASESDHPGALSYLAQIAASEKAWDDVIALVEGRYALAQDDKARIPLLMELCKLWDEQKKDLGKAAECCSRVLAIDPNNLDAVTYLGELELRRDRAGAYCALGERELHLLEKKGAKANVRRIHALHHRLARGYRDALNQRKPARDHLKKALELNPADFEAMQALEKLYEADLMWEELALACSYRAEKTADPTAKLPLYAQAARTWRDRSQAREAAKQAIQEYEKALAISPDEKSILNELADLAQKSGAYEKAAKTLEHIAEVVSQKERPLFLARAGRLYETRLQNKKRAVDLYQQSLEIEPNFIAAAEPLSELLYQQKQWRQVLPLYERLRKIAFDNHAPDEQARFLYQYGVVLENLGQDEQAVASYRGSLQARDHFMPPIEALIGLYERRRGWPDFAKSLELKNQALRALGKDDEVFGVLARLGEAYERLEQPDQALGYYRQAVEANPSFVDGFDAVGRLSHKLNDPESAVEAFGKAAEAALNEGNPERAAGHFFARGEILFKELDRAGEAVEAFEKALDANPSHAQALDRLARARYQSGSYGPAREAFQKLVSHGAKGEELADYENFLGRIALEGFDDSAGAIEHFEKALAANDKHRATYESLGELYEKSEQWEEAAATYDKFIRLVQAEAPQMAAPLHSKLGDLYKDKINRPEQAMVEYRKCSRLDPKALHPHVQLAAIFEKNPNTYGEAIKEHAALLAIDPFRFECYHRLFAIYEEQGAHDKAFCVASVLVAAGQARDSEQVVFEAQSPRNPAAPRVNFESTQHAFKLIAHPLAGHAAAEMMQVMGYAMARLSSEQVEKYAVTKQDKLASDDQTSLGQVAQRALAFLGGVECELYKGRRKPKEVIVLPTPRHPTVLLGADCLAGKQTQGQRAFIVGHGLWPLVDGSFCLRGFEDGHIARVVRLWGKSLDDNFPMAGDPEQIKKEVKLLAKEISRKQRKDAEPLLPKFKDAAGKVDIPSWRRGMEFSADRLGLVLGNDIHAALGGVLERHPGLAEVDLPAVKDWKATFAKAPAVGELLRFAASEEFFALRQRLKATIMSV